MFNSIKTLLERNESQNVDFCHGHSNERCIQLLSDSYFLCCMNAALLTLSGPGRPSFYVGKVA